MPAAKIAAFIVIAVVTNTTTVVDTITAKLDVTDIRATVTIKESSTATIRVAGAVIVIAPTGSFNPKAIIASSIIVLRGAASHTLARLFFEPKSLASHPGWFYTETARI